MLVDSKELGCGSCPSAKSDVIYRQLQRAQRPRFSEPQMPRPGQLNLHPVKIKTKQRLNCTCKRTHAERDVTTRHTCHIDSLVDALTAAAAAADVVRCLT